MAGRGMRDREETMIYHPTLGAHELTDMRAEIEELADGFERCELITGHTWSRSRNKIRHQTTRATWHSALLVQLRDSVQPAARPPRDPRLPVRRPVCGSREPVDLVPVDALAQISTDLVAWRLVLHPRGLRVAGVDWQLSALRQLPHYAGLIEVSTAKALLADVSEWWRWAAIGAGYDPVHLRSGRYDTMHANGPSVSAPQRGEL